MRLTATQNRLNTRLRNTIRRSYPLVGNSPMKESYEILTDPDGSGGLTQRPWIEALPKYEPLSGGFDGLREMLGGRHPEFINFMEKMIEIREVKSYLHSSSKSIEAWADGRILSSAEQVRERRSVSSVVLVICVLLSKPIKEQKKVKKAP